MIRIVIVDDQHIVREGLKMILSLHDDIEIIGEAVNGTELLNVLKAVKPDAIIMDIRMPDMNGIEATLEVKKVFPGIKIIILTTFQEDEYIFGSLKSGADGYVLKDSGSDAIVNAIYAACSGSMPIDSSISGKVVSAIKGPGSMKKDYEKINRLLTPREIDVVKQLLLGKSNRDIGKILFLSESTVKNYISHILSKLELNSRAELLVYLQNTL